MYFPRLLFTSILAILSIACAACSNSRTSEPTAPAPDDGGTSDGGAPDLGVRDAAPPIESRPCAEVARTCTGDEAVVVRGHAEGLVGLDGARVEFGIRYIDRAFTSEGLAVPRNVARGATTVTDAAFESCVCVPYNASLYPEIVGVVYAPGTTGSRGRDVSRAVYGQRFAVLADEELSTVLVVPTTPLKAEVAVAALAARSVTVSVSGLPRMPLGARVFAGLIADERAIAPELANGILAADGALTLGWFRPGEALPNERVVVLIDQNGDAACDDGDSAFELPFDGRPALVAPAPRSPAALGSCAALSLDGARE